MTREMEELYSELFDAAGLGRRVGEQIAALEGQTQSRWQTMWTIDAAGSLTVPQIARRLGVSRQNEQRVVNVNRLHILQRFHDYLSADTGLDALDDEGMAARYHVHLERAYQDFVVSNAIAEKTFKVHKEEARRMADRFVPLDALLPG